MRVDPATTRADGTVDALRRNGFGRVSAGGRVRRTGKIGTAQKWATRAVRETPPGPTDLLSEKEAVCRASYPGTLRFALHTRRDCSGRRLMAVKRSLRFQILRRDNHACRYCGASAPDAKLTVDHVVPKALGGTDEPSNLVTACDECNGGKSATPPDAGHVAQVAEDALRWAAAMREAAERALADREDAIERRDAFEQDWLRYGYGEGDERKHVPLPANWAPSVDRLLAAGLPMEMLLDCVTIAMGANNVALDMRFNYMCGCAWNKVTDLQNAARRILDDARPVEWERISEEDVQRWAELDAHLKGAASKGWKPTRYVTHGDVTAALQCVLDECDPPLPSWEYDRIVLNFLADFVELAGI